MGLGFGVTLGYIGVVEKNMETTIMGYIGFRVVGFGLMVVVFSFWRIRV